MILANGNHIPLIYQIVLLTTTISIIIDVILGLSDIYLLREHVEKVQSHYALRSLEYSS